MRLITLLLINFLILANAYAAPKTIHILVALCDNKYQGIVPVPAAIGNGQEPQNNLYWGAGYGLKTYFNKQKEWQLVQTYKKPQSFVLERIVYKHKIKDIYIVADAYDGQYIKNTIQDLFNFSAGHDKQLIQLASQQIAIGGAANLVIYVGHNGLMDWSLNNIFNKAKIPVVSMEQRSLQANRQVAVFACKSQQYFSKPLAATGISPAILTTHYMAPEGYVVYALVEGYTNNLTKKTIHLNVAKAYSKYQKLKSPALKLFTTEYKD